jgi:hypothetical protein
MSGISEDYGRLGESRNRRIRLIAWTGRHLDDLRRERSDRAVAAVRLESAHAAPGSHGRGPLALSFPQDASGTAQDRLVDHRALAIPERAETGAGGIENVPRPGDISFARREHAVRDRELRRVDAVATEEAERTQQASRLLVPCRIVDLRAHRRSANG